MGVAVGGGYEGKEFKVFLGSQTLFQIGSASKNFTSLVLAELVVSGLPRLPSNFNLVDLANPYQDCTPELLISALKDPTLFKLPPERADLKASLTNERLKNEGRMRILRAQEARKPGNRMFIEQFSLHF